MEVTKDDLAYGKFKEDVENRIEHIFENYSLEEVLEMNDLTDREVIYLLFMEGHINEPEAYFP